MTTEMIIALAIVIIMIGLIMSDKFSFGAPPLVAAALLVVTGVSTIQEAFSGFLDSNVVMIAGFMAVMAGFQKTSFMEKIESMMSKLASKGGFIAYALLILVVMLGASVMMGNTGYYVMVLTIAAAIPYNKHLPNSKLLIPLGFATWRGLIPAGAAVFLGIANSLLEGGGYEEKITIAPFGIMVLIMSIGFLIWALIAYRFLPDFDINEGAQKKSEYKEETSNVKLPLWKENITYFAFVASIIGMMFVNHIGDVAYIIPALSTALLTVVGVLNFKEARNNLFSPLIIMMASVIGVAAALANSGFTAMVGDSLASALGSNASPFILVLAFCLLTSAVATITGASIGALFVFAPIGIATCISLGFNPMALAAAITVSAWGGAFLPIDGLPALILGMGQYKLTQFLKFTLPMWIFQIIALAIGAVLMFPM